MIWRTISAILAVIWIQPTLGATQQDIQKRIDTDIAQNKPIVAHVVVALCDNANQGIVPVSAELGNGQNPRTNLYWGALYGVRTYFSKNAGWTRLNTTKPHDSRILERVIFHSTIQREGIPVPVYVVADAWDGAYIKDAIRSYLEIAGGKPGNSIVVQNGIKQIQLRTGGDAHLVAYVGHNGLMDFTLDTKTPENSSKPAKSAIVLACASKPYFSGYLQKADAHPLLLTTGLMAPEAYVLDAAIRSWVENGATTAVVNTAAEKYNQYQKCGKRAAKRLFWGMP